MKTLIPSNKLGIIPKNNNNLNGERQKNPIFQIWKRIKDWDPIFRATKRKESQRKHMVIKPKRNGADFSDSIGGSKK